MPDPWEGKCGKCRTITRGGGGGMGTADALFHLPFTVYMSKTTKSHEIIPTHLKHFKPCKEKAPVSWLQFFHSRRLTGKSCDSLHFIKVDPGNPGARLHSRTAYMK